MKYSRVNLKFSDRRCGGGGVRFYISTHFTFDDFPLTRVVLEVLSGNGVKIGPPEFIV